MRPVGDGDVDERRALLLAVSGIRVVPAEHGRCAEEEALLDSPRGGVAARNPGQEWEDYVEERATSANPHLNFHSQNLPEGPLHDILAQVVTATGPLDTPEQ